MHRPQVLLTALLTALSASVSAQLPVPASRKPPVSVTAFRHFSATDGMPGSYVIALAEDSRGFLWIGTSDGLCRWDGVRFYIPPEQYRILQTPLVRCLHMANDSLLIIGTQSGLCVYNIYTARYENERITVPAVRAGSGAEAFVSGVGGGRLLVSAGQELFLLDRALRVLNQRRLPPLRGNPPVSLPRPGFFRLPDSSITGYARLPHPMQALHIPTLRDTTWPPGYEGIDSLPYRGFYCAAMLRSSGTALFSGWNTGLIEYSPVGRATTHLLHPTDSWNGRAYAVAPDPGDTRIVWAGTSADLYTVNLSTRAVQQFRLVTGFKDEAVSEKEVNALLFDRYGALWIGTTTGLYSLSPQRAAYKTVSLKEGGRLLVNNDPLLPGKRDRLWAGCWGTWIKELDTAGTVLRTHKMVNCPECRFIRRMLIADDTVYAATEGGFFYYNERADRWISPHFIPDSLRAAMTYTAMRDSRRRWWISYPKKGLFCHDNAGGSRMYQSRNTAAPGYLPVIGVSSIAEDKAGGIWVANSAERGLMARLDMRSGRFSQVIPRIKGRLQAEVPVNEIVTDSAGGIWIPTEWFGILHYNSRSGHWTQYDQSCGLSSVVVSNIIIDWMGRVWALTANGLAVMESGAASFRSLTAADGVPFGDIQNFSIPDPARPWRMLINSPTAFAWIDLRSAVPPVRIPPVFIEGIQVEGRDIDPHGRERYSHQESHFTFWFAAPDISGGGDVQYAYKVEGLDEEWKELGGERRVSLANVPPGDYVFLARARSANSPWSAPARYAFSIMPPFWNRWWFYTLCVLAATTLIYAVYRYQLSKAIALLHVRNRISRDLHDEVGSTLSAISLMNELAARKGGDDAAVRRKLGERIRKVQDAMSDIVWMITPSNDQLENLVVRFGETACELLEPPGIRYTFSAEGLQGLVLPMNARRELYLIFKEALNNIVKYAGATEVKIIFARENGAMRMDISDNGFGFDEARTTSGTGLRNIVARATALKGKATISSKPGKGTWVSISLPAIGRSSRYRITGLR